MNEQQTISRGLPARPARALHVFVVPESLQAHGVKTIGIVELNAEEEIMATRRVRNDAARLAFELAKEALRMVDEQPVSTADGSADSVWTRMNPKVRNLVVTAWGSIHQPQAAESDAFLKSCEVRVG